MKNKIFSILLILLLLISCVPEAYVSLSDVVPSYLTEEQKESLLSLKFVDKKSQFYKMTYSADYKFDDIVNAKYDTIEGFLEGIRDTLLPESTNNPLSLFQILTGGGCSAFATKTDNDTRILARNYDQGKKGKLVIYTAPEGKNKSIAMCDLGYIGMNDIDKFNMNNNGDKLNVMNIADVTSKLEFLLYAPIICEDGINDKGLSCAILVQNNLNYNNAYYNIPDDYSKGNENKIFQFLLIRYFLDNCNSVDDAIIKLGNLNPIKFYAEVGEYRYDTDYHIILADKEGNSAIVEFFDGQLYYEKFKDTEYLTADYIGKYPIMENEICINDVLTAIKSKTRYPFDTSDAYFNVENENLEYGGNRYNRIFRNIFTDRKGEKKSESEIWNALEISGQEEYTTWTQIYNLDNNSFEIYLRPNTGRGVINFSKDPKYSFSLDSWT